MGAWVGFVSLVSFVEKIQPSNPAEVRNPRMLQTLRDKESSHAGRTRGIQEQHRYRPQRKLGLGQDLSAKALGRHVEE
jgi:hypothetical protein